MPEHAHFEDAFVEEGDSVRLCGRRARSADHCREYLRGKVRARLKEVAARQDLRAYLRDLKALTGFEAPDQGASDMTPENRPSWEVGEAIARILLEDFETALFPWPTEWDKKVAGASLPGPDLVGLHGVTPDTTFLFGEVKTSSEGAPPRGVIDGADGLRNQLRRLMQDEKRREMLIQWLLVRSNSQAWKTAFDEALVRYVTSQTVRIFGVLMRDTPPAIEDLRTVKSGLTPVGPRFALSLLAFYLTSPVADWLDEIVGRAGT